MLRKGKKINSTCYLWIVPFVVAQYIISDEVFTVTPSDISICVGYLLVCFKFSLCSSSILPWITWDDSCRLSCWETGFWFVWQWMAHRGDGGSKREDSRVFFPLCSVHWFWPSGCPSSPAELPQIQMRNSAYWASVMLCLPLALGASVVSPQLFNSQVASPSPIWLFSCAVCTI